MAEKTHKARPLNEISLFNAQVDIIVPFHGQYEKLKTLLDSIFLLTRSNYYKVCIVDDGSPNSTFIETLQENASKQAQRRGIPNVVTTVRNQYQLGFAGACQLGYQTTESPYVCFVNSDCVIEDANWLRAMGESLLALKDQGVRMVSATTNNAVGGDPAQTGNKLGRDTQDVILGDDSFLTLYCFLCHRELFQRVGGFLKPYPYGYFEDEEFAARLRKKGFRQAVSRASWIYHEGQATVREVWRRDPNIRIIMEEENRKRCIEDLKRFP